MATTTQNYESEWDCNPFAKVLCGFLALSFFALPHVILYQNSTWSTRLPLACAISLGALSVTLQVRMSMLRAEMNYLESEKLITNTDRFQRWTTTQLNHAEYVPLFISGLLFREYMSTSLARPLSMLGVTACLMSMAGCYGFVVSGGMMYPRDIVVESALENFLRKLGLTKFFRFVFVSVRYIALALIWVDLAMEAV